MRAARNEAALETPTGDRQEMNMQYKIGQSYAIERHRRILTGSMDPRWYILTTPPQKEAGATAWLNRIGAVEVWRPTAKEWRKVKGPRKKIEVTRNIVPGYVFAQFDREITWDLFFDVGKGRVASVVSFGGQPYVLPERIMAEMSQVPERLAIEAKKAEDARIAEALANMPQVGGQAIITDGVFEGFQVDITRIHRGIAHFIVKGAMNIPGEAKIENLRKV